MQPHGSQADRAVGDRRTDVVSARNGKLSIAIRANIEFDAYSTDLGDGWFCFACHQGGDQPTRWSLSTQQPLNKVTTQMCESTGTPSVQITPAEHQSATSPLLHPELVECAQLRLESQLQTLREDLGDDARDLKLEEARQARAERRSQEKNLRRHEKRRDNHPFLNISQQVKV